MKVAAGAALLERLRVFVASPGDVAAERGHVKAVADELNRGIAAQAGFVLEVVRWETHARPDMGRAEQLILDQIGQYDLFVGIMWRRFGTPTGVAGSGTEEEFDHALRAWRQSGQPRLLCYFSRAPSEPPETVDEAIQLLKVTQFRSQVENQSLAWRYRSDAEFKDLLREHLQQILLREFAGRRPPLDRNLPALPDAELPPSPEVAVPRQLPAAVAGFAGRAAELKTLTSWLEQASAPPGGSMMISAIDGMAGIGKTALAVQWAHQVAGQFPDGQLYVDLRGFDPAGTPAAPAEAVRGFLDSLEVPAARIPVSLDAQAALYRTLLAGRRVLVLLDNARDADQVRPLLPGGSGCSVVVTSRNRLDSLVANHGARPLTVDLLTDTDARQMLVRRLGADRVEAQPQAVQQIIAQCARLPLALSIVAARAAALAATQHHADQQGQAHAHLGIGHARARFGRLDEARLHLQDALRLFEDLGDQAGRSHAHNLLGLTFHTEERYGEALVHMQQAVDLALAAHGGYQRGLAAALNSLGWVHALLGNAQQAFTYSEQSLVLFRELGDRWGEAAALDTIGYAHQRLGRHQQAASYFEQVLAIDRELGDLYCQATDYDRLGDAHHAAGSTTQARHAWQLALNILDQLSDVPRLGPGYAAPDAIRSKLRHHN